jgi:hypothetical protein
MTPDAPEAKSPAIHGLREPSRPGLANGEAQRVRANSGVRTVAVRSTGEVRRALAPIEFTFDLRQTPAEKVVGRVFAALDRITPDVTLLVILRDIPEMAGVTANVSALLGRAGYQSDTSRLPSGGQRMRIRSRNRPREVVGMSPAATTESTDQSFEAPPPIDPFGEG